MSLLIYIQGILKLARWLTAPEQEEKVIEDFARERFGASRFFPTSKERRQAQGSAS
jgi:hypothetical protein